MKRTFLTAIAVCMTSCIFAQRVMIHDVTMGSTKDMIDLEWEYNRNTEKKELNCYNKDYCDYILTVVDDKAYNIRVGKTNMVQFSNYTDGQNPLRNSARYMFYRGNFPKDFQIGTPYALPAASGKAVSFMTDTRQREKTMRFDIEPYDTVYACRGGVACRIRNNEKLLLVCHKDHTFAAYLTLLECFITPGEDIKVGQPVGVCDHGGLGVSFFFLDDNRFEHGRALGYPYAHFFPYFATGEGNMRLEEKTDYMSVLSDDVITLDMTKAQKKKYFKKKK